MRGLAVRTLFRRSAVRAVLAGLAFLVGPLTPAAHARSADAQPADTQPADTQPVDMALAVPRIAPRSGAGVALPQPLPPSEAARVRRILALQARGDLRAAAAETERLGDRRLLGDILADRYLGRFHQSTPEELAGWLRDHADLPDAPAIRDLLAAKSPKGADPPELPASPALAAETTLSAPPEEANPAELDLARKPALDRAVRDQARAGRAEAALRTVARASALPAAYAAQLRAEVAQILFTQGRDPDARRVAEEALRQSDGAVGLAGYVAGLAAWRLGRPEAARDSFEAAARAPFASESLRAGAAFWGRPRAHLRARDPAGYVPWMTQAMSHPRTFYGLIARRALGIGLGGFAWDHETLGEADIEAVQATPEGARAFALLQVGQEGRAEAALRRLWPRTADTPALRRPILLVAEAAGLSDLAAQLAGLMQSKDGRPRDTSRFPVPRLQPAGGFRLDPALVYALARVESNFNAAAVSPVGARGLMQIMPGTASYLAAQTELSEAQARRLHDPAINLAFGQRYVQHLAGLDVVEGNLIRLLASYNSGPGNVARWSAGIQDQGDPLLFIESIPVDETRGFVPRTLAYMWIYAARMSLPAPSLDELAAGAWPSLPARAAQPALPARLP